MKDRDKIIGVLREFDVKPSYANSAVYNDSIPSFRRRLADRILTIQEEEILNFIKWQQNDYPKAYDISAEEQLRDYQSRTTK